MRCWSANGSPWRFIFFDGDAIRSQSFAAVDNALFEGSRQCWPSSPEATLLLRRLLQNPNYRTYFLKRVHEMARVFSYRYGSPLRHHFNNTKASLGTEIPYQSKRFGFPESKRAWKKAVRQQRRYWRRHCRKVECDWKKAVRQRNGESIAI